MSKMQFAIHVWVRKCGEEFLFSTDTVQINSHQRRNATWLAIQHQEKNLSVWSISISNV